MKVLVEYVAYRDAAGEVVTIPRGGTLPKDAPAERVKFFQAVGMVSKPAAKAEEEKK